MEETDIHQDEGRRIHNITLKHTSLIFPFSAVCMPMPIFVLTLVCSVVSFYHWERWEPWGPLHQLDYALGSIHAMAVCATFYIPWFLVTLGIVSFSLLVMTHFIEDHAERLSVHLMFRYTYSTFCIFASTMVQY